MILTKTSLAMKTLLALAINDKVTIEDKVAGTATTLGYMERCRETWGGIRFY